MTETDVIYWMLIFFSQKTIQFVARIHLDDKAITMKGKNFKQLIDLHGSKWLN